ncbi:MAG: 1-deoxy-D-xylulose-5-phosphate synthase [Oscillospiraceae bacterium]
MNSLLDTIKSSGDLKNLTEIQREALCGEVRQKIIQTVSENGGHLASNLGVVELTVALLTVFDPPKDSIVWDVGHQSYTHKLLTGRNAEFDTIRKKDGLSGFPSREESDSDPFTTGHSSTSISSALGISAANQIRSDAGFTIAVIGDGSLTGGLAFEGLNNAGRRKNNFIVVLNDNNMSISKNVGSMARYLTYIRINPGYIRAKMGVEAIFDKIPVVGKWMSVSIRRIKDRVKKTFYNSNIFEDLGFNYYGPYDGHDLPTLIETFQNAKQINKPILIHVRTVKGKGYDFAENNPKEFHGVPGFNAISGKLEPGHRSFSSVFGSCLVNMAQGNESVCAITAAMAEGTGLYPFSQACKERFFDVGIAEGHAITFAAGLARKGMIPVFAVYSTFLQRAYDNILHDVALQNLKVILAIDRAGVVGEDGRTHQGVFDVSLLKTIPGAVIFSPSYFDELDYTLQEAVHGDYHVVAVRYPRGGEGFRPSTFVSQFGDYDVFGDETADVCIVTYGRMFSAASEAAEKLKRCMNVKLIKLNKIFPINGNAVSEAAICKNILFVEEGVKGIAESFALELYKRGFSGKYLVSAIDNGFVPHASMNEQLAGLNLNAEGIMKTVKTFF